MLSFHMSIVYAFVIQFLYAKMILFAYCVKELQFKLLQLNLVFNLLEEERMINDFTSHKDLNQRNCRDDKGIQLFDWGALESIWKL